MNTTITIKLTAGEAERIAIALNFYAVEYNQVKREENPENKFWEDEWLKTIFLESRMFQIAQRAANKASK